MVTLTVRHKDEKSIRLARHLTEVYLLREAFVAMSLSGPGDG
jgi:hypothetical protein